MAVRFPSVRRASIGAALLAAMAVAACGSSETETEAPAGEAEAEAAPAAAVSAVASMTPTQVMTRAMECRNALRHGSPLAARLPADVNERLAATTTPSLGDLAFTAAANDVPSSVQYEASNAYQAPPAEGEPITEAYGAYLKECADVMDRAIVLNDERKAARAG
jgi:hypothetical protein